jgi:hypothetical protein
MKLLSLTLLFLVLAAGETAPFAHQTHSKTYAETRSLLLAMERDSTNRAFKKYLRQVIFDNRI